MRIDTVRTGAIGSRGTATRSASGVAFHVDEGGGSLQRVGSAAPAAPTHDIGSILALQAVEDPTVKKKKLVRRGAQLLDTLEEMKADLLLGRVSEGRINQLMSLISQARERSDPRLDALLDDIELRARVELAKRGHFPAI